MVSSAIISALNGNMTLRNRVGIYGWAQEQSDRAALVKKYRDYYEGDHDVKLSAEMKTMLRENDSTSPFSANYCELIVDKIVDRLTLKAVEADNDAATGWATGVLEANRLDALQLSVHESTPKDGDTYVLVDWNPDKKQVQFTHEPAWDGTSGMLVLYERANADAPSLAMKIWYVTALVKNQDGTETVKDIVRVNVYYPDRIERYRGDGGLALMPEISSNDRPESPGIQDNPMGVIPVVHFRNKGISTDNYGRSALRSAIPLQNVLNRTLVSMVMTSELTSFQIRTAKNFKAPKTVSPGGWIEFYDPENADGIRAEIGALPQGAILPFVDQANWTINQLATITATPLPGWESAGESGEAKKQREEGLLGKIRRAQVGIGNAWEDLLKMAHLCQSTYGMKPPAYQTFNARWASAEIRNNAEIVANAVAVKDLIPREEFYRILAPVFGWDDNKIKMLVEQNASESDARTARLGFPTFGGSAISAGVNNGNGNGNGLATAGA